MRVKEPSLKEISHNFFVWVCCPHCGLYKFAEAPHGEDPCPIQMRINQATLQLAETHNQNEIQEAFREIDLNEMLKTLGKMTKKMLGEDEDNG